MRERERIGEREKERSAPCWGATCPWYHWLATGNRCQYGWHSKGKPHDPERGLVSHFWETKKWRSMFSSSAQKAKISAHAIRSNWDWEFIFWEKRKKKAYPSSHNGSYCKEMTEHKCSMQLSMINHERKSLEALSQCKSRTLSIFF